MELTEAAKQFIENTVYKVDTKKELDKCQQAYNITYTKLNIINKKTDKKIKKASIYYLVKETLGFC